ncbi:MAG: MFS transporter [Defluviicoccus sp.]|nr:MFS transporter [Defluviicoccus sp.]MDE0383161.1 MFS transporter [Defluviicoccus sp.]
MRERFRRGGALTALLITVFMDMVGFGIIIPLTPFWAERFGAAPDTVTLLFATYSAFGLAFSFLWGWASDRWGRKPVLLASLMGSVLSFLWLGFAEALWMLFAARAVGGISGANVAVGQAYIADVTTEKNRARGFGLFGAAFGLGFVLGPAIGGILAGPDPADPDFRTPFMVAAAMSFVGVVFGLVFLPEPKRRERSGARYSVPAQLAGFARIVAMPAVAVPLLCFTMLGFVMGGLESTFAIWAEREVRWGPRETGFFFAYIGVLLIVVQGWLVGVLVKRYGEARVAAPAIAAMAAGIGMLPFSGTVPLIAVSGALMTLGYGLGQPSLTALISRASPTDSQGAILGVTHSIQSLVRVVGPITAGALFAAYGRDMPFLVGAAILAVAFAVALSLIRGRLGRAG